MDSPRIARRTITFLVAAFAIGCAPAGSPAAPSASAGSVATSAPPPALVRTVDVPQHSYALMLPAGWTATLGASTREPDTFSGPEGRLSVDFVAVPAGTAQDSWAAAYQAEQIGDFAPGCFLGAGAASESSRMGSEGALLFTLPCLPGWIVLAAYGDRGYDVRFTDGSGAGSPTGKQLLVSILLSVDFNVAASTALPASPVPPAAALRPIEPGGPIPDALLGAWYHPAPAFLWILRAGEQACLLLVRTSQDCLIWQPANGARLQQGILTIVDGRLAIQWTQGGCGTTSSYAFAEPADTLMLRLASGCQSGDLRLTRAGTGAAPTAPPKPGP